MADNERKKLERMFSHEPFWIYEKGWIIKTYDLERWGNTFGSEGRFIASTCVGEVYISTICLGIDYGFGLSRRPIIFETAVNTEPVMRWSHLNEARAGHNRIVNYFKNGGTLDEFFEEKVR